MTNGYQEACDIGTIVFIVGAIIFFRVFEYMIASQEVGLAELASEKSDNDEWGKRQSIART